MHYRNEDWIVTDDPLEIKFEEVTEQGKSKKLMELRNKMDWLPSIDLSHLRLSWSRFPALGNGSLPMDFECCYPQ